MKKILAAVDFSEPSVNAAKYAAQLVEDLPDATLTLYYVYSSITAGSDGSPLLIDDNDRKTIAQTALQNLRGSLGNQGGKPIDMVVESGHVVANLEKYVKHNGIDLVIMGITGSSKLEQMVVGSTTLNVITQDICPVLVIPQSAAYKKIKTAVLTSDLKDVESNTPVASIKNILAAINPTLFIVNVAQQTVTAQDDFSAEKEKLQQLFKEYNPKGFFILEEDFDKGVADFSKEYHADIIITVPKKHNFLARLFKSSHTQKLAYNSQLPILAIHS